MKTPIFAALAMLLLVFGSCQNTSNSTKENVTSKTDSILNPDSIPLKDYTNTQMLSSLEDSIGKTKNYVYAAGMGILWQKMYKLMNCQSEITGEYNFIIKLSKFNYYKNVLDSNEYSININLMDDEYERFLFKKRLKFDNGYIVYPYPMDFINKKVESFGASGYDLAKAKLDILYYKDDTEFIVELPSDNEEHQIILYMATAYKNDFLSTYQNVEKLIKQGKTEKTKNPNNWRYKLNEDDNIEIPKITFNMKDSFAGNLPFKCGKYSILRMNQRVLYQLSKDGSYSEMEASAKADSFVAPKEKPQPKHLVFDKPFVIIQKKRKAQYPYLAILVNNTELMTVKK